MQAKVVNVRVNSVTTSVSVRIRVRITIRARISSKSQRQREQSVVRVVIESLCMVWKSKLYFRLNISVFLRKMCHLLIDQWIFVYKGFIRRKILQYPRLRVQIRTGSPKASRLDKNPNIPQFRQTFLAIPRTKRSVSNSSIRQCVTKRDSRAEL